LERLVYFAFLRLAAIIIIIIIIVIIINIIVVVVLQCFGGVAQWLGVGRRSLNGWQTCPDLYA